MEGIPPFLWMVAAAGVLTLGLFGMRGLLEIRESLRRAEFDRLARPAYWPATRALLGVCAALPVLALTGDLGAAALLLAAGVLALGFWYAPCLLVAARRRVEQAILDDLALHLDLLALALESGCGWAAALAICTERAPEGSLRRAWERVILDIRSGSEPLDALRAFEQRVRLAPFATLVSALRAAEKLQMPAAQVLRDRARQSAAGRFARAERRARAAPIKLWAAMLLCLAPCTAVVLAFPMAQLLAMLLA